MTEHHIQINKTARYYTAGELSEQTKQVWLLLHGWGMQAQSFLSSFESLANKHVFLIAPEALNRFYLKGSAGVVGATWMTREDRLNEINDYTNYLDTLCRHLNLARYPQIQLNALGFSQGASTVTRWVNRTPHAVHTLVVYAGEVAPELLPLSPESGLAKTNNVFVCGNQDEYFTPPLVEEMKKKYSELNFTELSFNGKHVINTEVIKPYFAI